MRDISDQLSAGDLACCPLCDNAIEECHQAEIVLAHGLKQLVHAICAEDLDEDEDE